MTKQIVEFSSNDPGYRNTFRGTFRSERTFNKFIETWQHAGGFLRFNYDLLYTLDDEYPGLYSTIPANYKGYKRVMQVLYPDLY